MARACRWRGKPRLPRPSHFRLLAPLLTRLKPRAQARPPRPLCALPPGDPPVTAGSLRAAKKPGKHGGCMTYSCSGRQSKHVLQTELYHTRIARHPLGLGRAGDASERVRISNVQARRAQIHVIQKVEELNPKLYLVRFAESESLIHRKIPLNKTGQVQRHSRSGAKTSRRGQREGPGIEPSRARTLI